MMTTLTQLLSIAGTQYTVILILTFDETVLIMGTSIDSAQVDRNDLVGEAFDPLFKNGNNCAPTTEPSESTSNP